MEDMGARGFDAARGDNAAPTGVAWRDLRGWLALIERHGALHRIRAEVDTDEELSAITFPRLRPEWSAARLPGL